MRRSFDDDLGIVLNQHAVLKRYNVSVIKNISLEVDTVTQCRDSSRTHECCVLYESLFNFLFVNGGHRTHIYYINRYTTDDSLYWFIQFYLIILFFSILERKTHKYSCKSIQNIDITVGLIYHLYSH